VRGERRWKKEEGRWKRQGAFAERAVQREEESNVGFDLRV
jgi:hypothetical protein